MYVNKSITSGLRSNQASSPAGTLAGENAMPLVADFLVLTEQIPNFAARDPDVSSRDVSIGTDVLAQLRHESDAELADLVVRLALGVEVRTSLPAAHVHC
jgi:hypothetical protein